MKIIAVGDPHFRTDNIPEVDIFIGKMVDLVESEKPDAVVILGDVLHTHERLHTTPLNKAYEFIDKMRKLVRTFVLVGNHDMCFAKNTPLMKFDGSIVMSQDVKVGMFLTGPDLTRRQVMNVRTGSAVMYDVYQGNGITYTVTGDHLLCLRLDSRKRMEIDIRSGKYSVSWADHQEFKFLRRLFSSKKLAYDFFEKIKEHPEVEISVNDFLKLSEKFKKQLKGYKALTQPHNDSSIRVVKSCEVEFFGWEVDGDRKFLLKDTTVVHNCNNQQFLTENHWMNGMKEWDNVEIVDTILHRKISGLNIVLCPYVPPGKFREALDSDRKNDWKKADCIFAHQEFQGCKMGAIVSVEGDAWSADLPPVISGHIHDRQTLPGVYYCGSSMQHSFGETDKNIIPVLTWKRNGSPYSVKEVDLGMPKKKIVYTDVQSMEDYKSPESADKIKISISGVYDEFKAFKKTKKYKELVKKGTKIVFKPKKIKQEKIDEEPDDVKPVHENDFNLILSSLVNKEKDPYLHQIFELIVNNRETNHEDILFL